VGQSRKDDPAEAAPQGFEALMAGQDHVVAGAVKNRVQSAVAQVTPYACPPNTRLNSSTASTIEVITT
jgi:hypothetical protein